VNFFQPEGTKCSLKFFQRAITHSPDILQPKGLGKIEWRSPLEELKKRTYSDKSFLKCFGLEKSWDKLSDFWPSGGPKWYVLGQISPDSPVLVEVKAETKTKTKFGEVTSNSCKAKAKGKSRSQIIAAFKKVCDDLGIQSTHQGWEANWTGKYYQYANRISHLWWLRKQGLDAKLLFINFIDAKKGEEQACQDEWKDEFAKADRVLGLPLTHKLSEYIHHIYPNVNDIP
jgi:hypothetical protein